MAVLTPKSQPRNSVAGNTFTPRFYRKALGAAVGAVMAGLVLADSQAQAIVVTVSGQDWDVTTFTGSYNDNVSKFTTEFMPWWGSAVQSASFAQAYDLALGSPALTTANSTWFAYTFNPQSSYSTPPSNGTGVGARAIYQTTQTLSRWFDPATGRAQGIAAGNRIWAQATLVPATGSGGSANVPGPLPVLGLAAAFGFSRKLRKRIKLHRGTSSVSTPPGA